MTKSEIKQICITVLACIITAVSLLWWQDAANKKIAVVDAIQVFNSFKMKLELEAKASGQLEYLAHQADSLKKELTVKSKVKDIPRAELEGLYQLFSQSQARLEEGYAQSNQEINEQVWKRLNPLIDDYGKKQGLRLVIGANGMGNVLYNDDYYDHTKQVGDFVNKRYEEGL